MLATTVPLSANAQPGQTAPGNQGLQGGWAINDQGKITFDGSLSGHLDTMRDAGAGHVRINFRLGGCFQDWTSRGCSTADAPTARAVYDQIVTMATSAPYNLRVTGLLSNESWRGGQNQWIQGSSEATGGNGDNRYIQDFSVVAASLIAKHFRGSVDTWEVWNEPNAFTTPRGWPGKVTGGSYMYPSNFAWLLKRSYDQIKSVNPGATVISGGLFSYDADSGAAYLRATYTQGLAPRGPGWQPGATPFDGIGQHIYVDQGGRTTSANVSRMLQEVRVAYTEREGNNTPKRTYVTEIGWRSDGAVGPQGQADNLTTAYTTMAGTSYVARAFWFVAEDIPGQDPYGLADATGAPKPAFRAYQTYAR